MSKSFAALILLGLTAGCASQNTAQTAALQNIPAANISAGNELLTAQTAYRQALSQNDSYTSHVAGLQRKLAAAEKRLQEDQSEISRLQTELQQSAALSAQHRSTLQQAGERLDAAWRAVRGQ